MKRWIRWSASLYPAKWRGRYGPEFDALLDDADLHWRDLADVIRGAAIVQMTTCMSYWKIAALAGIAGAILAGGISFAIPNQYASAGAMLIQRNPDDKTSNDAGRELATALQWARLKVLGRDNLIAMIQTFDLYQKERTRLPMEEVAEKMFRKHVRMDLYSRPNDSSQQPFRIWFAYPDRFKVRPVVVQIMDEMRQQMTLNPGGPVLKILEVPLAPSTPVSPNRLMIVTVGLIAGMMIGLISVKVWRRTSSYAVLTMSIPKDAKRFVDSQVAAGPYSSVSEYVRELIRADEQRHK